MEEQLERLKINKDETTVAESPPPKVTVMKSQVSYLDGAPEALIHVGYDGTCTLNLSHLFS